MLWLKGTKIFVSFKMVDLPVLVVRMVERLREIFLKTHYINMKHYDQLYFILTDINTLLWTNKYVRSYLCGVGAQGDPCTATTSDLLCVPI
jgi:hypothetical protein